MKYEDKQTVSAVYTPTPEAEDNPLLEAMPNPLDKADLFQKMTVRLEMPDIRDMSPKERKNELAQLHSFFSLWIICTSYMSICIGQFGQPTSIRQ